MPEEIEQAFNSLQMDKGVELLGIETQRRGIEEIPRADLGRLAGAVQEKRVALSEYWKIIEASF